MIFPSSCTATSSGPWTSGTSSSSPARCRARRLGALTARQAVQLFLDTLALLWSAAGDAKLPRRVRTRLQDEHNTVHVSAASAWEIATKHRLGRLAAPGPLLDGLLDYLADQNFVELAISIRHSQRAGALPGAHRDPFDRMLAAQAQLERLGIVSTDRVFDGYGVQRIW